MQTICAFLGEQKIKENRLIIFLLHGQKEYKLQDCGTSYCFFVSFIYSERFVIVRD
jgi:hypothetical protein